MKNQIIITAISLATLAAITLNAGEALLSPRAKNNQTSLVANAANEPNLATANRGQLGSPRASGFHSAVVQGTESTLNTTPCALMGSPRQAYMSAACCKVAKANCTPERACCAK